MLSNPVTFCYIDETGFITLTLFLPMFSFDFPENIRKALVFSCFQGDQKGTLGRKRLILKER